MKLLPSLLVGFILLVGCPESPAQVMTDTLTAECGGDTVYSHDAVEQLPEFPGGNQALFTFISKHLIFSDDCPDPSLVSSCKLMIKYVVRKDGTVCVLPMEATDCLERAVQRVFRKMPSWKPGELFGKTVDVTAVFPISICLR